MFRNVIGRIAALPLVLKVLLAVAILVALGLSVVLSPIMVIVALLVLIVAIFALVFRALQRRPLRNWGLVALASFLLVILFSGITSALYGGGQSQQASSPSESKEEPPPALSETTTETTSAPKTTTETTAAEAAAKTIRSKAAPVPVEPDEEDEADREYDATVRVTRAIDGDTLEISPAVDGNDRVRLIGADTPETRDPGCVEPYGAQAKTFVDSELQGEEVELEFDEDREDQYDRLLAYVYEGGDMINETLLREGYAQLYIVEPNDRYEDRFEEAQEEARAVGRGLWALPASELDALADRGNGIGGGSGCAPEETTPPETPPPEPTPDPVLEPDLVPDLDAPDTPGTGGGSYPPISQNACPANTPIKGNQSGIYHVPGGQFYGRTNPEECFASEADAAAAGYRRSQR